MNLNKALFLLLIYTDYKIKIRPCKNKKFEINKNKAKIKIQAIRTWVYNGDDETTTSSEVQDIIVSKKDNNFIIEECYEEYLNFDFGIIDKIYLKAVNFGKDVGTELKKYVDKIKLNYKQSM